MVGNMITLNCRILAHKFSITGVSQFSRCTTFQEVHLMAWDRTSFNGPRTVPPPKEYTKMRKKKVNIKQKEG